MQSRIWMRIGDQGEYESFRDPHEAGEKFAPFLDKLEQFEGLDLVRDAFPPGRPTDTIGFMVPGLFEGNNYVSLYWGDQEADWMRDISNEDWYAFLIGCEGRMA